jgi:DNA-binding NarL/FixJ family response regulator
LFQRVLLNTYCIGGIVLTRVAIVEDSGLLRDLLVKGLLREGFEISASVGEASEAEQLDLTTTDVLLTDLHLQDGNGLELGIKLNRLFPRIRVIVLSSYAYKGLLHQVPEDLRPGWSYLLKTSIPSGKALAESILMSAVERQIDPSLASGVGREEGLYFSLDETKTSIIRLVVAGYSNASIAKELHLSEKSIEYHLTQVYLKHPHISQLNSHKRVALAMWGSEMLPPGSN